MKILRKCFCLAICLIFAASLLSACAPKVKTTQESEELNIYASFFPIYALSEMLTEGVPDTKLHCLVQPQDGCLRDYQLSDWDLTLLMRSADMLIIGGRGLESFENTLYSLGEEGPAVASVLYNKELAPAMLESGEDDSENHWSDENPHLYMDAEGAILIAESIAAQLTVADPANTELYMANLEDAEIILRSVLSETKEMLSEFAGKKVILMNETAVYIANAHGLEIESCINRDSGEAYYDFELEKCIEALAECESRVILIEKQAPERFCEALEKAGFILARIDTMSFKRAEEGAQGYLESLCANAAQVKAAFEAENDR